MIRISKLLIVVLFVIPWGCSGIGSASIQVDRSDYNTAIQRSDNEQLLLNLVRLKYRDTPFFLQVTSVASQFSFQTNASADASLTSTRPGIFGLGAGVTLQETPTVTYSPLQGEDFIQRFLSHIPLDKVFLLNKSGWSVDRVFRLVLRNLGHLKNAPNASGPTPSYVPVYKDFLGAIKLVRALQVRGVLGIKFSTRNNLPELILEVDAGGDETPELRELNSILGKPATNHRFILTTGDVPENSEYLWVETRSLLGMMYYLSHAIDTSEEDQAEGNITLTRYPTGEIFDWKKMSGDLLRVHSQVGVFDNAMVSIRYGGKWYGIKNSDLDSKSTFTLLSQIFSLQSGSAKDASPLLTLPVGK